MFLMINCSSFIMHNNFFFDAKVWLLLGWLLLDNFDHLNVILLTLGAMPCQRSPGASRPAFMPPLSQHSQLGCPWLPTPRCAALAWLAGHHAMPAVTKCFPPSPYTSPFPQHFSHPAQPSPARPSPAPPRPAQPQPHGDRFLKIA